MPASKKNDLIILDLFEAHEAAMYELYILFASKYPDYEDFWRGIAEEEKVHARWIREIRSIAEKGDISVATDFVSVSIVENSLEYLKNMIKAFNSQPSSVDKAFSLSMQIENSIVEKGIFDVVNTNSETAKKKLLDLVEKTRSHYFRIKEMSKKRTRLHGLVDSGIISPEDLATASNVAAREGESLESVIMKMFRISKKTILASISEFSNLPQWSFDAKNPSFPQGISQILTGKYSALKAELFVPVAAEGRKITLAIANPEDILKKDYIRKFFPNYEIDFRVGISDDILAAIDAFFGVSSVIKGKSMDAILHEMKSEVATEPLKEESEELKIQENDNVVVQLVHNIIADASNLSASDIHIEPSQDGDVLVRYRIDGMMSRAHVFPRKFRNAVSSRIKIMAGLDIAERRKQQSGKIRFKKWGDLDIELRVESYNTSSGAEDIVMRILSSSKPVPLEGLNFSRGNLSEFVRLISNPYGIFLCVGPTGSGKTTTLHSALKYLNK